jgi:hypothetical protein
LVSGRAIRHGGKSSAKYPIRAVAKITWLAIDTLRAWE